MKVALAVSVACIHLAVLAGPAASSLDVPVSAGAETGPLTADPASGLDRVAPPSRFVCPDIAETGVFKAGGLGYVQSREFSAALKAVAGGASRYSPPEIPPGWRSLVEGWGTVPAGPAGSTPRGGEDACSPALLYLASLEYRAMRGNPDTPPVYPRIVRVATRDLETLVAEKQRMSVVFARRSADIQARITEAERLGAGDCSPEGVSQARSDLDRARREASGVRSSLRETESAFASAEGAAERLLSRQRYASSRGIRCYGE